MPIVRIDYDSTAFTPEAVTHLAEELQKAVGDASTREQKDVSVFASANQITINAAPMEIFVELSTAAIPDGDKENMLDDLTHQIREYKRTHGITASINLSVVEMDWKFAIGI